MQIRWRQYELIFSITVAVALCVNEVTDLLNNTPVVTHRNAGNTLWAVLLTYGVPVLLILIINCWLLPRFLYSRYQLIVLPAAAIVCWLVLVVTFTDARNWMAEHPGRRQAAREGLGFGTTFMVIYVLYLGLRESVMRWLNRQRQYIPIANRIVATAFIYSGLFVILGAYDFLRSDTAAIFYVFIVLPVIIIVFINVYGLFPNWYNKKLSTRALLYWLPVAPLILSLVCWLLFAVATHEFHFYSLPLLWMILVVVATPLSYLFFVQQKDKLQLHKDLGKTTADLAFLRSQINPHFLFNTLNTLYGTALQENASRTASGVQRLGDMMRFLLHDNHRDEIPLNRELEYLQNYIALQQLRIAQSAGVQIETSIHACVQERMIAPMLLIPFVENAFKHGIRLTSASFIRIHFHCDEKGIYLDVVNSLHSRKNADGIPEHSGVGLDNVRQRLDLIYPGKHSLQIHEDDTAFEVHLFIKYKP